MASKTVAVMQPYFFPYLGYYSLFARADEVVLLDCVQFPRRGRIHRCQLPTEGKPNWLTLPLAKAPQSTRIAQLRFADNAHRIWADRLSRQSWYSTGTTSDCDRLREVLEIRRPSVVDYLDAQISTMCDMFGLTCRLSRSSMLDIDPALQSEARIIAIAVQSYAG